MRVLGVPTITIDVGGTDRTATYRLGSGNATLTFRYLVQGEDVDADGIEVKSPIVLGGHTAIRDDASNDAVLTFSPAPAFLPEVFVNDLIITAVEVANGNYSTGNNLDINLIFSKSATVQGSPTITIDVGGNDRTATYVSGSGSGTLTFRYAVQGSDSDLDGIEVKSPIILGTASDTIRDNQSNNAKLAFDPTPVGFPRAVVNNSDSTAPVITSNGITISDGNYLTGDNLDIQVVFSEPVYVTGLAQIRVDINGTATSLCSVTILVAEVIPLLFAMLLNRPIVDLDGVVWYYLLFLSIVLLLNPFAMVL